MKLKDKYNQFNKMYEDVGYHNRFIALFALIVVTAIIDIVTIPFIVKEILDVKIPRAKCKRIDHFCRYLCFYFDNTMLYGSKTL